MTIFSSLEKHINDIKSKNPDVTIGILYDNINHDKILREGWGPMGYNDRYAIINTIIGCPAQPLTSYTYMVFTYRYSYVIVMKEDEVYQLKNF